MITADYIIKLVELKSGHSNFHKDSRKRPNPDLRFITMQLCKEFAVDTTSLAEIGKKLNNKDHATVINGLKKFDDLQGQQSFKFAFDIYKDCKNHILQLKEQELNILKFKDKKDLETHYKIQFIKTVEKYRSVIKKLQNEKSK